MGCRSCLTRWAELWGAFHMRRAAAVILLVFVCAALAGCGIAVPDVTGRSLDDAKQALTAAGLTLGGVSYDEAAVDGAGTISNQVPAPGERAKDGSSVALVIAGPPPVKAPSILGLTPEDAQQVLSSSGLVLGSTTTSYDSSVPVGCVVSQEPSAGVVVPKGAAVSARLSDGPAPVEVPKVTGKPERAARKTLETLGFKVNRVSKDSGEKKGTVLKQKPAAGKLLVPGMKVTISVSTGVQLVRVPKCYGLTYEDAQRKVRAAGLTPKS